MSLVSLVDNCCVSQVQSGRYWSCYFNLEKQAVTECTQLGVFWCEKASQAGGSQAQQSPFPSLLTNVSFTVEMDFDALFNESTFQLSDFQEFTVRP